MEMACRLRKCWCDVLPVNSNSDDDQRNAPVIFLRDYFVPYLSGTSELLVLNVLDLFAEVFSKIDEHAAET